MKYRREIDGLRAVAVLPVIFFHAGFEAFGGGFVGVDVFFVISGYLITTIILAEKEKGTFSLVNFYERRARRILPALFFVMICCLPFAWFWLMPDQLEEFSKSLLYISSFISNFLFWKKSGYFDTAAELKPLLHTWSLAVEEQYYMLFPLFLMLLWKLRKRWMVGSLFVVAVASLALAQWGAYHRPAATFYLLPARFWELAIGALISFYFYYKKNNVNIITANKTVNETLSLVGISMICYSIIAFDKSTPFPSFYALFPTIGTGLIIVFTNSKTFVGRFLGTKVMVGIGLISYSAYLWHNPLFVFARHQSLTEPSTTILIVMSALSIVLAYFSWRYIEIPFRNKDRFKRKNIFSYSLVGSVAFIAIGMIGYKNDGFVDRFNIQQSILDSFSSNSLCKDFDENHNGEGWGDKYCTVGSNAEDALRAAVFGDSHAAAILPAFDIAGKKSNYAVVSMALGGCPPLFGVDVARGNFEPGVCEDLSLRQYEYVKNNDIKKVFLVSRWSLYTDGEYGKKKKNFFLISNNENNMTRESSRLNFESSLKKTIKNYEELGVEVNIVLQIPQQDKNPKYAYMKMESFPGGEKEKFLRFNSLSEKKHHELQKYNRDIFKFFGDTIKSLSLDELFCNDGKCLLGSVMQSYYVDLDHMSIVGSELVADRILIAFQENKNITLSLNSPRKERN
jgi:peptidoglycan/LPS O-acetylase OafA/YrhL